MRWKNITLARNENRVYIVLIVAYLVLTSGFGYLGYLENIDRRIRGHDSVYYYSYLRSAFFDRDLNFENEWAHFYGAPENRPDPDNVFSIGPAILWTPFFALGHVTTLAARFYGYDIDVDGYSKFYQAFVYIGNSLYGLVGVLLMALFVKKYLKSNAVLIACLAVVFSTQLTYYFWSLTAMSHNASFATTALFLYYWRSSGASSRTAVAAALMSLVRWQNILFLVPLAIRAVVDLSCLLRTQKRLKNWSLKHLVFLLIFLSCLVPQFVVWKVLYDQFLLVPQGSKYINFGELHLGAVLFDLRHGLFLYHPILLLGLIGCGFLWRKDRFLTVAIGIVFALQWILNAAISDWWAGWSFGHRRFVNLLPLFALGFGLMIENLGRRAILVGVSVVLFTGIWNQLFIFQYIHGLIPRGGTLSVGEMFVDKFYIQKRFVTQATINTAIHYLNERDIDNFEKYAKRAYEMSPNYRNSPLLYSLSCMYSQGNAEALRVFQQWYRQKPNDLLVRWGLAEFLVKAGKRDEAEQLFRSFATKGDALSKVIYSRIINREKTLVDQKFFDLYNEKLENIRVE